MEKISITENIKYIGVVDKDIDLFESQYVVPNGVTYNSYVILDEKIAVMDTVDKRAGDAWLANLTEQLNGRTPDYLIVSHMEPDHAGTIAKLLKAYPDITVVGNAKTFVMIPNFFDLGDTKTLVVAEGNTLSLGKHVLQFFMAPMVHWPEVMVTYEQTTKTLFSADAFGTFGPNDKAENWDREAARYYFNIVGKYGAPVQGLLKKVAKLEVARICPLHGPVLAQNLGYYVDKYLKWSSYQPEKKGVVVAHASIHGNTKEAAEIFAEKLRSLGENVVVIDLTRDDMAYAVEQAFIYDRLVLAAASYDGSVFTPMEVFLIKLKSKGFQNRKVAIIENGSWAPWAAKTIKEYLAEMKNIQVVEQVVTVRSTVKEGTKQELTALAETVKSL